MRISTRHVLSDISIHALRVEGDWCAQWNDVCEYISIHALRVEGDLPSPISFIPLDRFLSTPSGWRATSSTSSCLCVLLISIHALRVEGD